MNKDIVKRSKRFEKFSTDIDQIDLDSEQLVIRGKNLCEDIIGEMDFIETIYHTLLSKVPSEIEKTLLNASLVSIHTGHQAIPPTIHAGRVAASTRAGVAQCLSACLASSGEMHLGAVKHAMKDYLSIEEVVSDKDLYFETREIVRRKLKEREIVCGFGHPYMEKDPRSEALRNLATKLGYETNYLIMHDAVRDEFYESKGKFSNVDGINGAIFLSLGFEPEHGEGLFLLSRMVGALAHIVEEYKRPPWSAWSSLVARHNIPGLLEKLNLTESQK